MEDRIFDQNYVVREALDDLLGKVATREKMIESARQLAERKKEEKTSVVLKNFEHLMVDFVSFYQPILEKIQTFKTNLQNAMSDSKSLLSSVKGVLEVTKSIEGMSPKVKELETDQDELDRTIKDKVATLEKVKTLFDKVHPYTGGNGSSAREDAEDSGRTKTTKKTSSKN